jgi:hypothetical protein
MGGREMSRLAQIHNDYLDPDMHLWPDEDYGYEGVLGALKKYDTGGWQYKEIDCCLSGKDADLELGDQGIQLNNVDDEFAYATVRGGKTVVGDDCCFNLKDDNDEAEFEKAKEAYLEQMTELVCGCGYPGEWSGNDWFITFEEKIKVPIVLDEENGTDGEKTAEALLAEAERVLKPFEKEMEYLRLAGSQLAGWKDARGRRMREGRVPKCAAWKAGQ